MAVTKILARNAHLDQAIQYVLNGEKTEGRVLTAHQNCDPGHEYQQMMDTKRELGKTGGRQCYHIIQSFKPGEITPELALELAKGFAAEYLPDYEVVIGTHTDRDHIHSHILFNSVNAQTGEKYHVSTREYYRQIRAISDRLCREHGLSVVLEGQPTKAVSYIEWLRQSKGQPTFRSMLEADLKDAMEDANDLGHFFLLMEHKGYEIKHGSRLGFRLRGQERYMIPGRKDSLFTEDGIRAAIEGNLDAIAATEGIDLLFVGPYDLSSSMGAPGQVGYESIRDTVNAVLDAARRHGKLAGIFTKDPGEAAFYAELGMHLVIVGTDIQSFAGVCRNLVDTLKPDRKPAPLTGY